DANAAVNPAATEACNSIDDDCDVSVDEGLTQYTYYADADGDTYGNPGVSQTTCQSTAPTGYVTDNTDCNDANAAVHPNQNDYCNGTNDDCDGNTDEDGANPNNSNSGIFESYVVINDVFYDLQNATANPDFPAFNFGSIPTTGTLEFSGGEIKTYKNGGANICGGKIWYSIYPSAGSPTTWVPVNLPFAENLSNPGDQRWATTAGTANLANGLSAGSYKIAVYVSASGNAPGQTACACDPYHVQPGNDLYWVADFAVCQAFTYYADADGDTYGNASVLQSACSAPSGYVSDNTDCNDANAAINPAATEICDANDTDEDCDGLADDADLGGATGKTNWYADGDTDTFGAGAVTLACNQPVGQVANNTDCDDSNDAIRPNATEQAGDNVDQNCDGAEICFTDADDDGYRPGTGTATVNSTDADCNDANEAVSSDPTGDCDDANDAIRPNATELAGDNVDQNCDGAEICYVDADDDTYRPGTGTATVASADADCDDPFEALASDPTNDCNDANPAINPGATEICNGIDDNCNGVTDVDNVPPTAVCHANVTIAVSGTNSNYAAQLNNGSSDNCTPTENLVFTTSPASLGCAQIGQTITATLTVADLNGNTADCTSSVSIEDGAPTAVCKNTGVALNAAGMASLAAADVNNGSFDQCGSIVSMAVSPNMFDCNDVFSAQTVTLTVTDNAGNSGTCQATVTVLDVLNYTETPGLRKASDGLANDNLGWGVGIDGPVAIVGAPNDKVGTQAKQGSAYVFLQNQPSSNNWGQLKQIKSTGGEAVDYFGNAVSIDGNTALVGGYGDNVGTTTDAGSAYIFEKDNGGTNNWGQAAQLSASDFEAYEYFGHSVALKNGIAAVGANKDKIDGKAAQGSVYIFAKSGSVWPQVKKITAHDGAANNFFGNAVSQSNGLLLVGANGNLSNRGAAYLYGQNTGGTNNWGLVKKLTASDAAVGDGFGTSVSLSGDYALAGAPNKATYAGAAYVFKKDQGGAGNWGQVKKLAPADLATNDRFGASVALTGDYAYVTALRGNSDKGAVYVFHKNQGGSENWGQIGKYTAAAGAAGDQFGYALGVSGNFMAVGANLDDVDGKADQGAVYFFTGADCPDAPKPTDETTSTTELGNGTAPQVRCQPNPFRDELTIEVSAQGATHLQVTDAAGRLMLAVDLPAGATRFDLNSSTFRGGLYFVQVSGENGVRVVPVALVR
ncbi:MAG: MopE-related protein, partial [Saprospiraceae bacterium]